MAKKQRLDKAISMQGNLSRSEVKTLIRKGAVTVNGQVVKAADFGVDFDSDTVQVQGKPLCLRMHLSCFLASSMPVLLPAGCSLGLNPDSP